MTTRSNYTFGRITPLVRPEKMGRARPGSSRKASETPALRFLPHARNDFIGGIDHTSS
jgi:hypothetical protein